MINYKRIMKKLKVLDLFSGCGGMDIGINGNFNWLSFVDNSFKFNKYMTAKKIIAYLWVGSH